MTLNAMRESKIFHLKVDSIIGNFMNATSSSRQRTHLLAMKINNVYYKKKKKGNVNKPRKRIRNKDRRRIVHGPKPIMNGIKNGMMIGKQITINMLNVYKKRSIVIVINIV